MQKPCFVEDGSVTYTMKNKHLLKCFTEAMPKTKMEKKIKKKKAEVNKK